MRISSLIHLFKTDTGSRITVQKNRFGIRTVKKFESFFFCCFGNEKMYILIIYFLGTSNGWQESVNTAASNNKKGEKMTLQPLGHCRSLGLYQNYLELCFFC